MKNLKVLFVILSALFFVGTLPAYAHKGMHGSKVKHAMMELKEAKELLGKATPDADGHIVKATQAVDQAMTELSAVKEKTEKKS